MKITIRNYRVDCVNDKIYALDSNGRIIRTFELFKMIDDESALVFNFNSNDNKMFKLVLS